jgi:flagellar biosynthetic protein FlhB
MADQEQEQNKSEEASPFKLRRAREKGQVARGMDLGFFGGLAALAGFLLIAGETAARQLAQLMRQVLGAGIAGASDPRALGTLVSASYWQALQPVVLLGATVMLLVLLLEIAQLRGLVFTTQPLKPDFSRINPAKGLKRLFSMRIVKEAAKNVLKFAVYCTAAWLVIGSAIAGSGRAGADAAGLARAMQDAALQLLLAFLLIALFFAGLDQLMVRREFRKQMRMSRRELTREVREREGEPRLKQRRKQLHAEFAKEVQGLGDIAGSDLLVVNPEHYAVALAYDVKTMAAPTVKAKARNQYAQAMKREAFRLGIPMFEDKPLARTLYAQADKGAEIDARHFRAVAELYMRLAGSRAAQPPKE